MPSLPALSDHGNMDGEDISAVSTPAFLQQGLGRHGHANGYG